MHQETINEIAFELRKIKPDLILHGEAWPFSDLEYQKSYIKGTTFNNLNFAYFNDTIRDAIKGDESHSNLGLYVENNPEYFKRYVSSIVGNLKDYDFQNFSHSNGEYDLFVTNEGMNLAYSHCHDGATLWDKLLTSTKNLSFEERIERYRQALILSVATNGRQLMLAGTELLQTKPLDQSGMEEHRSFESHYQDEFNENADQNRYQDNSYKTTDYTNGLKWQHLKNPLVVKDVFEFVQKLNYFRNATTFFRMSKNEVLKNYQFELVDSNQGIIVFTICSQEQKLKVIHNFSDSNFNYDLSNYEIVLTSSLEQDALKNNQVKAHSSVLLLQK
ncbi:Pullulanase (plasmid) [Mycoplasmopsis gallopavonis]|uniref:Pullulanase n=2 Tax=Mycoplasmopsis gallopavonis TaxID=76629 RepID=A0A449B0I8_9BACT|nr:Pullulanase [Mycoplasmopsis gallopavonis]